VAVKIFTDKIEAIISLRLGLGQSFTVSCVIVHHFLPAAKLGSTAAMCILHCVPKNETRVILNIL